jgi:sulfite exporter TauE/SafE
MALLGAAFILGLAGSLHCVGMCGPIALVCCRAGNRQGRRLVGYHLGRFCSYAVLGGCVGGLGEILALAGFERALSIGLGSVILIALLLPKRVRTLLAGKMDTTPVVRRLTGAAQRALPRAWAPVAAGLATAFLPCGLLYVALAAAAAAGSAVAGAAYMAVFALGTTPAMIAVLYSLARIRIALPASRLYSACALVLGCLLIVRGLALDIPYLSPPVTDGGAAFDDCCASDGTAVASEPVR